MRCPATGKLEIIRLVEQPSLSVRRNLGQFCTGGYRAKATPSTKPSPPRSTRFPATEAAFQAGKAVLSLPLGVLERVWDLPTLHVTRAVKLRARRLEHQRGVVLQRLAHGVEVELRVDLR